MDHSYHLRGVAFSLRPVSVDDVELIVRLRSNEERAKYLHSISPSVELQKQYLADYFQRPDDYYFAIVRNSTGCPEGFVGLYNINKKASSGEWGRWILDPKSLGSIESALLIYRFGFETLRLSRIFCRTVCDNESVVHFHRRCGVDDEKMLPAHFHIGLSVYDAVEQSVNVAKWPVIDSTLSELATRIATRMTK